MYCGDQSKNIEFKFSAQLGTHIGAHQFDEEGLALESCPASHFDSQLRNRFAQY